MSENQKIVIQTEIDASSVKPTLDKAVAEVNSAAKKISEAGKAADPFSGVSAGAESAAKAAKTGADQISEAVKKAGAPSGQTPDPFGPVRDKMEQSAKAVDRTSKSIANAVQRAYAEVGTAGKGSVEYFERLATLKGANFDYLGPYLDKLRQAQEAQRVATAGIDGMGMSAKATNAALRQIPAQFTDIVVSLQGGQAPLTVLLQQGGQLKDVFGGVGAAAAAMGNYIAGLITPVTTLAAAVGVLALAYKQGSDESDSFRNALILTGNAAGTTVGGLQRMAAAVAEVTGSTKGAAAEALVVLANSTDIATSRFEKFAAVAVQANKLTGAAIGDTVKAFSDLGEKPLEASVKLNEKTRFLTVALYDQIKALEDQGRASDAAALAQNAYADTLTRRLGDIRDNLGYLESGWSKITGAAKSAWDAMLDIGREKTPEQQLDRFNKQLQNSVALAELARKRGQTVGTGSTESDEITGLQEIVRLRDRAARAAADEAARVQDKIKWDKMGEGFQDKGVKLQRELNAQIELGTKALKDGSITADEYSRRISGVLEKYRDKSAPKVPEADPFKALNAEIQKRIDLINEQLAQGAPLTAWEKARIENEAKIAEAIRKRRELGKPINQEAVEQARASARLEEEAIKRAATQTLLAKQLAEAEGEKAKVRAELDAASDKLQARENELALASQNLRTSLEDSLRVQQAELTLMGASAQQRAIVLAQLKNQIAYERELQRIERLDANTTAAQKDRMRADARLKLETENAMAVTQVWADTAKSINDALTNAFMEAASSGKNVFDALARSLEREFASLVLRPVVSALMQPVANQVASAVSGNFLPSGGVLGGSGQFGVELFGKDFNMGEIAGYLNAASLAAGGKWGQAAGSALGTYAGATLGGPLGAAIGSKIGEAAGERLDVWFGGGTYAQNTGDGRYTFDRKGAVTNKESSGIGTTVLADESIRKLESAYRNAAKELGISTVAAQFGYGSNNSDGGKFIYTSATGSTNYNSGEVSPANLQLAASRAVLSALQGSELPERIKGIFDAVDINNISKDQIDTLLKTAAAVNSLGKAFDSLGASNVSGVSGEVIQAMADFSGGLGELATNLSTYYDQFYSAEEKRQRTAQRIVETLGNAGGTVSVEQVLAASKADFRAVVEQTDPSSPLYAALLSVAGAFADIAPVAKDAETAIDKTAAALKEQASWQQRLDIATGKLTSRQAQLQNDLASTTDATTQSIIRQYYAQLDMNDAADAAATAAEKAATALRNYNSATTRIAVGTATLAGATPDQTALIAANAALTDAIQAIRDAVVAAGNKDGANISATQIDSFISSGEIEKFEGEVKATLQALLADYVDAKVSVKQAQDSIDAAIKSAADAAAQAAADAAADAARAAAEAEAKRLQERQGLQDQLDRLTMTNTQLLEKQRNALDASNRALFDQVQAAEKAKAVADERKGLQDQLDSLTMSSTQLLEKQRNALDESNRALFDQIEAAKKSKEVASERKGLQDELDNLTLSSTDLLKKQRDALDESNRALFDQVQAAKKSKEIEQERGPLLEELLSLSLTEAQLLERRRDALDESNRGLFDSIEILKRQKAVAEERKGLQDQLDELTLSSAELLKKQRDALDESNRALFDQVQAVKKAKEVADERKGIQDELDSLTLSSTELLKKQRDALDESNRTLFDQVIAARKAKEVADERKSLQDQLDELTLSSTELLKKQRDALDESNRALFDQIEAARKLKAEQEQTASLADRYAIALGTKTQQQIDRERELAGALTEANRATLLAIFAEEDLAQSRADALQKTKDTTAAAFSSLQRAVDAQRKAVQAQAQVAQESVNNLQSIFDALKGGIDTLLGTVGGFTGDTAQTYLTSALETARKTGYLPDAKELSDAVSAAVQGVTSGQYATGADAEFAKRVLAGTLTGLQEVAKPQLSTAEEALRVAQAQLDSLDGILATAQAQIDAVNGVDVSVRSISSAIADLAAAITAQAAAQTAVKSTASTPTGATGTASAAPSEAAMVRAAKALYFSAYGGVPTEEYNAAAAGVGGDLAKALGWSGNWDDLELLRKRYSFAVGTNYVPYDMVAQVHEGEAIVPKAYNPAAGGTDRTAQLIEALTAEVQRLQAIVSAGNSLQRRTADAVNGAPEMPMLVKTV